MNEDWYPAEKICLYCNTGIFTGIVDYSGITGDTEFCNIISKQAITKP